MKSAAVKSFVDILIQSGKSGLEIDHEQEIDLNPVIIVGGKPIVVDALIRLK